MHGHANAHAGIHDFDAEHEGDLAITQVKPNAILSPLTADNMRPQQEPPSSVAVRTAGGLPGVGRCYFATVVVEKFV